MRALTALVLGGGLMLAAGLTTAQPPGGKGDKGKGKGDKGGPGGPGGKAASVEDMVTRMMTLDADKDGKLTNAEVTDGRLQALFERADADKDGVVTKDELTALFTREAATLGKPGGEKGGPGGPPPKKP